MTEPGDWLLQAAGFRIRERPDIGVAVWERAGRRYSQTEAVALMRAEALEEERLLELHGPAQKVPTGRRGK